MQNLLNPEALQSAINTQIKAEVQEHVERIADAACEELRAKIMSQVDQVALGILSQYDVQRMGTDIKITVRKDLLDDWGASRRG